MVKPLLKLGINLLAGFSLFFVPILVSNSLADRGVFGEAFVAEYLGASFLFSFAMLFLAHSLNRLIEEIQLPSS
ncbi:MAG: hypothetical protein IC227_08960 [Enterococcus lacertideformus]|uniref:Uncharacterized protein n=1 Tax=Enterococcus lacertideformus TaxID=2771493 RepID=A0A931FA64_9ENTE|nr:hypothetical protein [Enterococcus lacertideformus]